MASAQEKTYTVDDIYALPDGQRAELIDGQIYMMAPPRRIHQELVGRCKVYPAPLKTEASYEKIILSRTVS